ncbi:MAG: hypothetical protein WHF31_15305 [Candidatus Dehalobacter alkaniphilus]
MIIKTQNGMMLCDFKIIKVEAFKSADWIATKEEESYIGKFVLNGYIDKDTKIMLRSFDTADDAISTLNAIYANIPAAISLAPQDYIAQNEVREVPEAPRIPTR